MSMKELSDEEWIVVKAILCGFVEGYEVTSKVGYLNYILPQWVHRVIFRVECIFHPELLDDMYEFLSSCDGWEEEDEE